MDARGLAKVREITSSFNDDMIEDLKDVDEARGFLEVLLEEHQKDPDTPALMMALRDIIEAQGGISNVAKRSKMSRSHLYKVFTSKESPYFITALRIFSGLGFRVRLEPVRRRRAKKRAVA